MTKQESKDQPPQLLPVLQCVWNEVVLLEAKWDIYENLFGRDEASLHLLNRRTGSIFSVMQRTLIDDIILTLAKLCDRAKSRVGRETRFNATFRLLLDALPSHIADPAKDELSENVGYLERQCEKLIIHRNRRIAHLDLKVALKEERPEQTAIDDIKDAIAHAKGLLNDISNALDGLAIGFPFSGMIHEADLLFQILHLGNEAIDRKEGN